MNNYCEKAISIANLLEAKQEAYGDSFNKACEIMRILYPNGIRSDQYKDSLAMIRVIDKLFRIATRKNAFGEDPWQDIAGYAILSCVHSESHLKGGE